MRAGNPYLFDALFDQDSTQFENRAAGCNLVVKDKGALVTANLLTNNLADPNLRIGDSDLAACGYRQIQIFGKPGGRICVSHIRSDDDGV